MRAGSKKALSLLRWGAPGVSGPYTVERAQDRENYQDGDRSLTRRWGDMPYSDVKEPHPNADTDLDAEETGKPAKRLNTESVVRQAVMELIAESDEEDLEREKAKHLDSSGAFSGPLWGKVAPLVDAVLDLMRMNDSADHLKSNVESSSIRKKELILAVAKKAELFGFGYRTTKKDWNMFMELVPALTGMFSDSYRRDLLKNALGEWKEEYGSWKHTTFAGEPGDNGFDTFDPPAGLGGRDTQEFYEQYVPGAIPRQETYNVKRIVSLAEGDLSELSAGLHKRMDERMIVDFTTARVNTQRLQSMMRYVTDQPDSELAMAIVVGAIVRDAVRQAGADSEEMIQFDGARAKLNMTPGQLISGMQGGTKRIIDEWLSMAISIMRLVGVLPDDKEGDDKGEDDKPDTPKYQSLQNRMRENLVKIGLKIAEEAIQGLHDRNMSESSPDDSPLDDSTSPVENEAERINAMAEMLDDALGDDNFAAATQAAQGLHDIMTELGASSASLSSVASAIARLKEVAESPPGDGDPPLDKRALKRDIMAPVRELVRTSKAASVTVADIAKRIIAPAKVRIVTQDEAEDGIELDDNKSLKLPDRYHAASCALGGLPCLSR